MSCACEHAVAMHAGNLGMIHTQKGKGERHTCLVHKHATAAWDDLTTTSSVCGQDWDWANNGRGKTLATCVFSESASDTRLVTPLPAAVPRPPALSLEAAAAVDVATVTARSDRRRLRLPRKLPKRRLVAGCCCCLARC